MSNGDNAWTLGGAAVGGLLGLGGGFLSNYFGRKSQSRQAELNYEMANYNAAQNYLYSKKYNEQNYELAERYATNSALWSTLGLKKAGLNPLLVAGNGGGSVWSQAGVVPSASGSSSVGDAGGNADLSEAIRDGASLASTIASAKQMDSQASLNEKQEALTDANTAKAEAEIESIHANAERALAEAERTRVDTAYRSRELGVFDSTKGQQGVGPYVGAVVKDFIDKELTPRTDKIGEGLGRYLSEIGSRPSFPSSARQRQRQVRTYPDRNYLDSSAKDVKSRQDDDDKKRRTFYQRARSAIRRSLESYGSRSPVKIN